MRRLILPFPFSQGGIHVNSSGHFRPRVVARKMSRQGWLLSLKVRHQALPRRATVASDPHCAGQRWRFRHQADARTSEYNTMGSLTNNDLLSPLFRLSSRWPKRWMELSWCAPEPTTKSCPVLQSTFRKSLFELTRTSSIQDNRTRCYPIYFCYFRYISFRRYTNSLYNQPTCHTRVLEKCITKMPYCFATWALTNRQIHDSWGASVPEWGRKGIPPDPKWILTTSKWSNGVSDIDNKVSFSNGNLFQFREWRFDLVHCWLTMFNCQGLEN